MLVIRPEQLEVFGPIADAMFVDKIVEYLLVEHADTIVRLPTGETSVKDIPRAMLRKMVRNGMDRARDYGLASEHSLASFITIMFMVAPNFDEHPLIHRALENEEVEPDDLIDYLLEITSEENWQVAEQNYKVNAWDSRPSEN